MKDNKHKQFLLELADLMDKHEMIFTIYIDYNRESYDFSIRNDENQLALCRNLINGDSQGGNITSQDIRKTCNEI